MQEKELPRLSNGTKVIEHHVETTERSVSIFFTCSQTVKDEEQFFRILSDIAGPALVEKGWVIQDSDGKRIIDPMVQMKVKQSNSKKEWIFEFSYKVVRI